MHVEDAAREGKRALLRRLFDLVSVRIRSTESRLKTTSVVTVLFRILQPGAS
jgi:hypothetical protein